MKKNLNIKKAISRTKLTIFFLLLTIFCFLIFGYFYTYYQFDVPATTNQEEKVFFVKSGERVRQIAKHLEDQGLIRSSFYFELYVLRGGQSGKLQAGEYLLRLNMTIREIVKIFIQGKVVPNEVQVTIPEGLTIREVELKLVEAGLVKGGGLAILPKLSEYSQSYEFLRDLGEETDLEGFLFPDTYKFYKETTPKEIFEKMLDNFDKKITNQLREEIKNQNKTIFEIVTLASIVQNEAASKDEMKTIAGVLDNRLKRNYPLQSDVTVNYVTGKNLRQPTIEDTKIKSPYNTYLNVGLPPGPISNPGINAILASIYPEDTDYFYFLHPLDGSAIFSKTLEEHNINKAKYLK